MILRLSNSYVRNHSPRTVDGIRRCRDTRKTTTNKTGGVPAHLSRDLSHMREGLAGVISQIQEGYANIPLSRLFSGIFVCCNCVPIYEKEEFLRHVLTQFSEEPHTFLVMTMVLNKTDSKYIPDGHQKEITE